MTEIPENNNEDNSLDTIINEINLTIFSKENWVDNEFYKIPEMTYSYEKLGANNEYIINKTLFEDLGNLDIKKFSTADINEKKELINAAGTEIISKIQEKISNIKEYLNKFDNIEGEEDNVSEARKDIIKGGLEENIIFLQIALGGLDFEKEKAILGIYFKGEDNSKSDFYINSGDRVNKLEKIGDLNTQIFGEKLSSNEEYIEGSLDYLFGKFEDYKAQRTSGSMDKSRFLSEDEETRYNAYINKLQNLSQDYEPKKRIKPKSVLSSKWKKIMIYKDAVKNSLDHSFVAIDDQSGNMPHRVYYDDDISGFTDTPNGLGFPTGDEHQEKSAFDMLRLTGHEIEQHSVSQVSHEALVGDVRGKKNLEVVEGTAMLWEEIFEYGENMYINSVDKQGNTVKIIDFKKITYVPSFAKTSMEEILSDKEFLDFLELQNKIEPDKITPLNRYLRFKRTGFQRKDITYTTGKLKVAQYYNDIITGKSNGDFSDLYLGKVGFDDIENLKLIRNDYNAKNDKLDDDQKVNLPENLLFSESTVYGTEQRLKRNNERSRKKRKKKKVDAEGFYNYLQKKYPFLNVSRDKIDSINFGFKKQLLGTISTNVVYFETYKKGREKSLNNKQVKAKREAVKNKAERILKSQETA